MCYLAIRHHKANSFRVCRLTWLLVCDIWVKNDLVVQNSMVSANVDLICGSENDLGLISIVMYV